MNSPRILPLSRPLLLSIGLSVALLHSPASHAKERFGEVARPIEDFQNPALASPLSDASGPGETAPLSRKQQEGKSPLGKALVEVGQLQLTGYTLRNGRLVGGTFDEPLGGAFDPGVLEGRGLENGGRFETRGFETPLKGWFPVTAEQGVPERSNRRKLP